jgi:hypothetical protein
LQAYLEAAGWSGNGTADQALQERLSKFECIAFDNIDRAGLAAKLREKEAAYLASLNETPKRPEMTQIRSADSIYGIMSQHGRK